jgi:hypothetical protein
MKRIGEVRSGVCGNQRGEDGGAVLDRELAAGPWRSV